MYTLNRFKAPLAIAVALALPVITNGCSAVSDATGDLCCTDFKVGADLSGADFKVDASIKGQFAVLAQAGSDFSATATAMVDDVTNACRGIAQDLGATDADQQKADLETNPTKRVSAWCALAVAQLQVAGVVKGQAVLTISPPEFKCEASLDARANCQAKCDVSGKCEAKVEVKCDGKLPTVSCDGGCKAEVDGGSFSCKGKCDVTVSGTCTAEGGVDCKGKCEGTCSGSTDSGGNCQGTCKGTCSVTAPSAKCEGTFQGECKGTCTATGPSAKVECDAKCTTTPGKPLKCDGKATGGCNVEAKCDANCDASIQAKASCEVKPFEIKLAASGTANANLEAAIATLKINLPRLIIAVKARGKAIAEISANFAGAGTAKVIADPGKLGVKGTACALAIVGALGAGAENAKASIEAGLTVTSQIGL